MWKEIDCEFKKEEMTQYDCGFSHLQAVRQHVSEGLRGGRWVVGGSGGASERLQKMALNALAPYFARRA